MPINYEQLMALKNLGQKYAYTDREVMLYAYGIGMGADPMDENELAYVTLKEGPSLQTNIVDCDLTSLRIGQKVKLVWKPTDGAPLPFFTPA